MLATMPEEEAVDLMLGFCSGDDGPIERDTGVSWRPLHDTYRDTIAWLLAGGYLDARWAPAVARAS
jgi:hypothetical protein